MSALNAARTYRARKARTRLNLAITYLEAARFEAQEAGMRRQATTLERLHREATELLPWFPLGYVGREQVGSGGGSS